MRLFGKVDLQSVTSHVPWPVRLYALLGLMDFFFTLLAFQYGFQEGNPILAWYQEQGVFEVVKVGTTIAIVILGFLLWKLRLVRAIICAADIGMFALFCWHLFFWVGFLNKG
ncbi:MAG: hypothetical protein H0W86_01435 [Armatimonadetes bacterium]|nr:hypothetical protein [Armatimonadota bacterium]